MRDFSWKYFMMTGDVDAYLLYREIDSEPSDEREAEDSPLIDEEGLE